jgi:probable phosphoglycerate mutase
MTQSSEIIVYIDGASRGNPGPAAYAVVVELSDGSRLAGLSGCLGETTNNVAEYHGLLAALEYTLKNDYRRIQVRTDSELLALQIKGTYRVKSPGLKPLYDRARRMIAQLESFSIRHVPREQNSEADRLANQALDAARRAGEKHRAPAGVSPAPDAQPASPSKALKPLRAAAAFRQGNLEPHEQLPLLEGEVVDLEIFRRK